MQLSYEPGDRVLVDGQLLQIAARASNRWGGYAYSLAALPEDGEPPRKRWLTARLVGTKANVIDRRAISDLVHTFYGRIRADEVLGPIFEARLADRWDAHLDVMVRFWSSVLLAEGSFDGQPMPKHRAIAEGEPEHFVRWLALFRATLDELFTPPCAELIAARSKAMARGLSSGMFGRPFDMVRSEPPLQRR